MRLRACLATALTAALVLVGCVNSGARHNEAGLAAYEAGRYEEALGAFREAADASPDVGEYYYNLAMSEQALGLLSKALFHYRIAAQLQPSLLKAYQGMAQCHLQEGRKQKALEALELGTRANPYTARAYVNVARFHLDRGDVGACKFWMEKAVFVERDSPLAHREYGLLLLRTGEREKGIQHLRKSFELDPTQTDVASVLFDVAPTGDQLPPPRPEAR